MSKESELYQWAMIAVVQAEHLIPVTKIDVIDLLLSNQKIARYHENESLLGVEEGEE